jgi:amino acid transporter
MKKAAISATEPPASARIVERIVHLRRVTRIGLAALFALALTLALTPIVDRLYIDNFFNPATRGLPAMISTALGLVFYVVGWRLIIGYVGETPPARRAIFWYAALGAAACAFVILLVIIGAITGTME